VEFVTIVKAAASITTVAAAILVASNWSAKIMVAGFSLFVLASLLWIAAGWSEEQPSLYIQNLVLLAVNIVGIIRWLPRAEQGR
jgi:hypothetical protein